MTAGVYVLIKELSRGNRSGQRIYGIGSRLLMAVNSVSHTCEKLYVGAVLPLLFL